MRKAVAGVALNFKAVLCIEVAGGMDMEIRIPNVDKERLPAV